MSQTRIARVYAGALYEAAVDAGKVDEVRGDLTAFVDALAQSAELRAFLLNEQLPGEEKKQALMQMTEGGEALVRNFLRVLVDKHRESVLEEASVVFVDRAEKDAGVVKVELATAVPVLDAMRESLVKSLETSLGKRVELTLTVDESVLGGVKLRIGDRIADASLRHRLEGLRARLVSPTARLEGSVEAAS
ncbi:MAG TPA: ATP synthase F1 subunit delta [Thermoleophilia bacterium]|nr:ATP synthase F1 subunit delta [Thermoleophilia bacterium]HZK49103.1 ATP synthase F1 subunit delta [Thermoleophilia bacterium]